ncbi:hypothetical protein CEXT_21751 [Caerostris extrusa]|uniref:Uncharacterized protein n=1 Tax=Caerostris extrusa TaxID=172846 RepID=A0AAV4SH86_CAEEX|nr:hypothetical protein CEXT_21751 [Caerostris extrusa]
MTVPKGAFHRPNLSFKRSHWNSSIKIEDLSVVSHYITLKSLLQTWGIFLLKWKACFCGEIEIWQKRIGEANGALECRGLREAN